MDTHATDKRSTFATLGLFLVILAISSAVAHFAIVRLVPTSLYVGTLMMMPALSAFVTLKLRGRNISSLPWRWGGCEANWAGYLIPVFYVSAAYGLIWVFGFGGMGNPETLADWRAQLGLPEASTWMVITLMVVLMAVVQFVKSLGTIAGEEIGWRGFLVWELRKLMSFEATCLVSGLLWAVWHYPVIIAYGGGNTLFQLACFTLMIVAMSVIMTYYTFRSGSLWPAVMFHGAHNIFIQKIYTPLTLETEQTGVWIDEYGLMVPLVVTVLALIYWRKARAEGL
ncbi:CPBP family intramembrane glutamic endopeptidase [Hyphobacterium indicum]|uniref:CPBP family intramembrane glutamic endopeptidase n=1 Tax=Hyphobacterium indicum TaxID=2162714 RepID=UPI000D65B925|nr:type II CAAX endopeptidase family protein [Hyphobacterium indicum]